MNHTSLINSAELSKIGLGFWQLGGLNFHDGISSGWEPIDYSDAKKTIKFAFNEGINHFDTADCYGDGLSEKLLGQILQELSISNQIFLSSKIGFINNFQHHYSKKNIIFQLENSLKNLKREYLDIYYFHHSDFGKNDHYLDEAMETMEKLHSEGKIRCLGLSCYKTGDFARLIPKIKPKFIQGKANILDTKFISENSVVATLTKKYDVKFIAFSPFEHGILLNKYKFHEKTFFAPGDHRQNLRKLQPENLKIINQKLGFLAEKYGAKHEDFAKLCLNFLLYHKTVSGILFGFRNKTQVEENLKYKNFKLTNEDVCFIKSVVKKS